LHEVPERRSGTAVVSPVGEQVNQQALLGHWR
jgi:hypothetical protein